MRGLFKEMEKVSRPSKQRQLSWGVEVQQVGGL
jgi:hypothetical protein